MKSDLQRLKALLAADQRSDEDEQWLLHYLETTDTAALRELLSAQYQDDIAAGNGIADTTSRELWDQIRMRVNENNPPAAVIPMKRRGRVLWWAAAVGLLLAGSFYHWYPRKASYVAAAVITPGSRKAVLTLADGKKISLNDTATQVIRQGSTHIRQEKGELQYAANDGNTVNYNLLTTPRGGEFQLSLPDGSKVWLNAASSLKYPTSFNGKRIVELTGQAYFEIAKNAGQPFVVKVNEMEVQVLGTSFDIMAYPDEAVMNTTLLTGAVSVKHQHTEKKLQPGQQTVLNTSAGTMSVQPADIEKVMGWKNGLFDLENTDLPTLLRQLSRWYDINIIDQSEKLANRRFGGRIGREMSLTDVLKILEQYDVHCRIEGRTLTVLSE